jgi:peroxiredoxin
VEAGAASSLANDRRLLMAFMKWRSLEESNSVDLRPLREIFAERKALIEKYVPDEVRAVHQRVVELLQAEGIGRRALQAGATVPFFELKDHTKNLVSSVDLLSHGRLVICFFRGRWDPFCCGQLEAMNQIVGQIHATGASLVAISPQNEQQAFFMADQHKLKFPLLSDAGNQAAKKFGLAYRVLHEQQEIYKRVFINLPRVNGDDSWELPIPATYIVERDGTVLYANANPDYTERPEPLDILAALEKL